jgi:hypothetical protein
MHFNLINWLFQDPCTATGCYSGGPAEETFHFYALWITFCAVGLLVSFYYSVEGRKRFTKNRPWLKYMLDRYLGWLAIICIIGGPLIFSRAYLDYYFFAWRAWRYLWLLGLLIWAILFIVHRIRVYPREREYYQAQRKRDQYIPKANRRSRPAASH